MLTAFQCATGAYITEDGELLCQECFDSGDDFAKPVSNYALDEEQTAYAEGYEWDDEDGIDHAECEPALFDVNGHELREAYHYHRDETEPRQCQAPLYSDGKLIAICVELFGTEHSHHDRTAHQAITDGVAKPAE